MTMMVSLALAAITMSNLHWLAGSWEARDGETCTEEHWFAPADDVAVGVSRTTSNGKTVSYEFMRIEQRPDGIFYVAQPRGKPPFDFKLASDAPTELVLSDGPSLIRSDETGPSIGNGRKFESLPALTSALAVRAPGVQTRVPPATTVWDSSPSRAIRTSETSPPVCTDTTASRSPSARSS